MRRRVTTIAIFLVAAALLNVAVAWALQLWVERPVLDLANITGRVGEFGPSERSAWARAAGDGWPKHPDGVWVEKALGSRFTSMPAETLGDHTGLTGAEYLELIESLTEAEYQQLMKTSSLYGVDIVERGWPALTLRMCRWDESHRTPMSYQSHCNGYRMAGRYFPIRPLWAGFAFNTIIYAVFLWLLVSAALLLRRFLRQRRGLCPACAYPMGQEAVCTECGKLLPQRAVV